MVEPVRARRLSDQESRFNEFRLRALEPQWAGGRLRLITDDDQRFIVTTATTRPRSLEAPLHTLEHPQARRLPGHQAGPTAAYRSGTATADPAPPRRLLPAHPYLEGDPRPGQERPARPYRGGDRRFPDRCFAFDQFGQLSICPHHGSGWVPAGRPDRLPATSTRTHGIRYFHGCYSLGNDQLWGVWLRRQGGDHTWPRSGRFAPPARTAPRSV